MSLKSGDIVLVLFPDSNLRTAKRRPALVVQADGLQSGIAQTIVAMITSKLARAGHPSRVTVKRNSPSGHKSVLRTESVVMTDNLTTITEQEIDRTLGILHPLDAVNEALRKTLGL